MSHLYAQYHKNVIKSIKMTSNSKQRKMKKLVFQKNR